MSDEFSKMSIFIAEPGVGGDDWLVTDRSTEPPEARFRGTQEECECVARALNVLARQQYGVSIAAENKKRFDHLMRWDREREEKMRVLEEGLRDYRR